MDTVGVMSERGRYRKYRVAVYAVCGSAYEVEIAFDRLIETMLSDRREDYFWGVMLDHAPSPLFRTFGDGEIEGRVRKRFDELCRDYPQCGSISGIEICLCKTNEICRFDRQPPTHWRYIGSS